jgi:hypothetical protein
MARDTRNLLAQLLRALPIEHASVVTRIVTRSCSQVRTSQQQVRMQTQVAWLLWERKGMRRE